jgi:hypothetical protein
MRLVTVDSVRPGQVSAAPVADRRGRLLIPHGVPLTERHIHALKVWGITSLAVEGELPPSDPPHTVSPEVSERLAADIDARFESGALDCEVMRAFRNIAFERALRRRAATQEAP